MNAIWFCWNESNQLDIAAVSKQVCKQFLLRIDLHFYSSERRIVDSMITRVLGLNVVEAFQKNDRQEDFGVMVIAVLIGLFDLAGLWINAMGCSLLVSLASLICLIMLPFIFSKYSKYPCMLFL